MLTFVIVACWGWREEPRLGFVVVVEALTTAVVGTDGTTSFGLAARSGHPRGGTWKSGGRIYSILKHRSKKHSGGRKLWDTMHRINSTSIGSGGSFYFRKNKSKNRLR